MDAMVFLLSPQSTLHSQSPQRIPSRNPDMILKKKKEYKIIHNDTLRCLKEIKKRSKKKNTR